MEEMTPVEILKKQATDPDYPSCVSKDAITRLLRIGVDDAYAIDVLLPIVSRLKFDNKPAVAGWAAETQIKMEQKYKKDWRKGVSQ